MAFSPADVERLIADLPGKDAPALRVLWRQTTGREPGPGLKGELLRAALAHRLQERAFGGVSPFVLRRLRLLVREAATFEAAGDRRSDAATSPPAPRRIKPGSRLIREWKGITHEVVVVPEGYLWNGTSHPSLSAIALAITGTSWNGWRFFGLDRRKTSNAGAARREVRHAGA